MSEHEHLIEAAYVRALEAVAQGATKDETRAWIGEQYPGLSANETEREMANAFRDALDIGTDREDIDPSWFGK